MGLESSSTLNFVAAAHEGMPHTGIEIPAGGNRAGACRWCDPVDSANHRLDAGLASSPLRVIFTPGSNHFLTDLTLGDVVGSPRWRKQALSGCRPTLPEAIRYFSDPDAANEYVVSLRWPGGPVCPRCGADEHSYISTRRLWKCKACKRQFSVKVGTIFEGSPLGLDKWLPAIWVAANAESGISSRELGAPARRDSEVRVVHAAPDPAGRRPLTS